MNKLAFVFAFLVAPVFAQAWKDDPVVGGEVVYACQYTNSAGFRWENGRWESPRFNPDSPFFLTTINNNLAEESVAASLKIHRSTVACHDPIKNDRFGDIQTCSSSIGMVVTFSVTNMNGAVARTLGGAMPTDFPENDDLEVAPFICTKVE